MCACEPNFICAACRDTPQDWRYEWDEPAEPEPVYAESEDA